MSVAQTLTAVFTAAMAALAMALVAPAAATAQAAPSAAGLIDERVFQALVLQTAELRIRVAMGETTATQARQALIQTAMTWRDGSAQADPATEAASLTRTSDTYLSFGAGFGVARWPADMPAGEYRTLAELRLIDARARFAAAVAVRSSPEEALADAAQVRAWMFGQTRRPGVFDGITAEAAEVLAAVIAPGTTSGAESSVSPPPRLRPAAAIDRAPRQPPVAPGPGAAADTATPDQIILQWAGMTRDEVAPGGGASADGKADAAFLLDASRMGSPIVAIDLYDSDAQGQPKGNRWSTRGGGYWILGVTTGAGRVNGAGYMDNLNLAPQTLTIFAAEPGRAFVQGQYFAVEVAFADGRRMIGVAIVP